MNKNFDFDIIVVGAGHAGVEACLAASRLGMKTLLITTNLNRIAYMSCNPSIGGLAKGHMVREIDILGGLMGFAADESCIQFKRLNASRGPAVRGTRMQSDKSKYSNFVSRYLRTQENLVLREGEVKGLLLEKNVCCGIFLEDGSPIKARSVIITTGTFMNGIMHVGSVQTPGGRVGDKSSVGLSDQLRDYGFSIRRLKTGTPARLIDSSIDWSKTTAQYGDARFYPFSLKSGNVPRLPQVPCYLSRTTAETHEIIRKNIHKSPMYCGIIEGVGPRYCPSIEDKISRFADKESHQTFLEPEGLDTNLIYLQGISTSLPVDVQDEFLRTIPGLENVKVARYGYAVEYDFVEPTQIWHRLESRNIEGLFLAGQVNGTSGYEEAAAQGLVAGINAAYRLLGRDELVLTRDQAYIGVLIDDLVTKGTSEPYRMFTSRAEHRLVLREDNTLDRLGDLATEIGLVSGEVAEKMAALRQSREVLLEQLRATRVTPTKETQSILESIGSPNLLKSVSLEELLRRPEVTGSMMSRFGLESESDPNVLDSVEIEVKYSGYIKRQIELIKQAREMQEFRIPELIDYKNIRGLSAEEIDKLTRIRPRSIGQAGRISGVNPSAIQALIIYLKSRGSSKEIDFVRHTDSTLTSAMAD